MRDRSADLSVSATNLCSAYMDDETAATSRYSGKLLQVNGAINSAGRNRRGNLFATLHGGGQLAMTCYFLESEAASVAALTQGQALTVKGRDDTTFLLVTLRDCIVVASGL